MSNIFRKGQWIHHMLGITRCSVAISQPLHAKDFGSILVTCDQLILFPAKREYASKSVTWRFCVTREDKQPQFWNHFFQTPWCRKKHWYRIFFPDHRRQEILSLETKRNLNYANPFRNACCNFRCKHCMSRSGVEQSAKINHLKCNKNNDPFSCWRF